MTLFHATPPVKTREDVFEKIAYTIPVPLLEVTGCRWPVSEHPWLFCDAPVFRTKATEYNSGRISSFCQHHHRIAYPRAAGTSRGKSNE